MTDLSKYCAASQMLNPKICESDTSTDKLFRDHLMPIMSLEVFGNNLFQKKTNDIYLTFNNF